MNVDLQILNSLQVSPPKEIVNSSWSSCPNSKVIQYEVEWFVYKHDYDDLDVGEVFKSPVFNLGNYRAWIDMYPRGAPETYGYYESDEVPASLFLQFENGKFPADGSVEFQICSRKAGKKLGIDNFTEELGWGCQRIWREGDDSDLNQQINCVVTIVQPPISKEENDKETQMNLMTKLSDDLVSLLDSEKFFDVTIKIGEHELRAHKNILSARSDVFKAMFQADMSENRSNIIEITDVDVDVMKHLLRYVYSGRFQNVEESAEHLMAAADKYGLDALKMKCSKMLKEKISIFNVANLLVLAERYQDGDLIKETFSFIKNNWKQVQESDAWKELRKVRGDLAFFVHSIVKE